MTDSPDQETSAAALAGDLRTAIARLNRRLREQSDRHDLSMPQKSVLYLLDRNGPSTVTQLARAENMRPQSMGASVATLEEAGLIAGAPDPADGRRTILSLTDKARDWIAVSRAARQDWLYRALRAELSVEEQRHLAAAIPLLAKLAEA